MDSKVLTKRSLVTSSCLKSNVDLFSSKGSGKLVIGGIAAVAATCYSTTPVSYSIASASSDSGPEFKLTASGLRYRDITVGTGTTAKKGDEVSVHYTGWLEGFDSAMKFDSSYDRNAPLEFNAGVKQVIEG